MGTGEYRNERAGLCPSSARPTGFVSTGTRGGAGRYAAQLTPGYGVRPRCGRFQETLQHSVIRVARNNDTLEHWHSQCHPIVTRGASWDHAVALEELRLVSVSASGRALDVKSTEPGEIRGPRHAFYRCLRTLARLLTNSIQPVSSIRFSSPSMVIRTTASC
jgi:hypothetical protein